MTSNVGANLMKTVWRSIFAVTIVGVLLVITNVPSDAARRQGIVL
jgi:hypothetical protein